MQSDEHGIADCVEEDETIEARDEDDRRDWQVIRSGVVAESDAVGDVEVVECAEEVRVALVEIVVGGLRARVRDELEDENEFVRVQHEAKISLDGIVREAALDFIRDVEIAFDVLVDFFLVHRPRDERVVGESPHCGRRSSEEYYCHHAGPFREEHEKEKRLPLHHDRFRDWQYAGIRRVAAVLVCRRDDSFNELEEEQRKRDEIRDAVARLQVELRMRYLRTRYTILGRHGSAADVGRR